MNNLHRFLRTFILLNPCHVVNLIYEQHIYSINSMKIIILTAGLLLAVLQTVKAETKDYTHFVNPMVGTGAVDGGSLAGNTFPGATFPFGMIQLSPDVEDFSVSHQGYEYSHGRIFGFSHTHQSGTGAADLQDILLMPTGVALDSMPSTTDFSSPFSHEREEAHPGFYYVDLLQFGIRAFLTATARTGMHKYVFPEGTENNVLLDIVHGAAIGSLG